MRSLLRPAVRTTAVLALLLALPAAGQERVSPEEVGMSAERLARLTRTMEDYVDEGRLPASLLRLESLKDRRRSGRARKPLGDAVSPLGVINSDENIASLRALLDERVSGQEGGSRGKNRRKYSE